MRNCLFSIWLPVENLGGSPARGPLVIYKEGTALLRMFPRVFRRGVQKRPMSAQPILHKKLLELSDAVSRMNRQILAPESSALINIHEQNRILIERCDELLAEFQMEKLRQKETSHEGESLVSRKR